VSETLPVPGFEITKMPEVKDLERKNLHNQMWTFTNKGEITFLNGHQRYSILGN
jgi:Mn-containing catalase